MHAVKKAIGQAKKALLEDHLDCCLDAAIGGMTAARRQEMAAFKAPRNTSPGGRTRRSSRGI